MDVGSFFSKKKARTVALIDIGSASIGGAYARIEEGKTPVLIYTTRVPIQMTGGTPIPKRFQAALDRLGRILIEKGSPALSRVVGSGTVDDIFTSIGSPWQETQVRVKTIDSPKPFLVTNTHAEQALADEHIPEGRMRSGQRIIATLLNGYEVNNPFGKRASRADFIVLSSTLPKALSKVITDTLKRWYHAHAVLMSAFAPIAYEVYREAFPHEKDYLVLEVSGEATDLTFVKKGMLVDVASLDTGSMTIARAAHEAHGVQALGGEVIDPARNTQFSMRVKDAQETWMKKLHEVLQDFSSRHALPRTVFLLCADDSREYLKRLLAESTLQSLWLAHEPICILPTLPSHLSALVSVQGEGEADTGLMMLAIAYSTRREHGLI